MILDVTMFLGLCACAIAVLENEKNRQEGNRTACERRWVVFACVLILSVSYAVGSLLDALETFLRSW